MCLAIPMKIKKINGRSADCEAGGLTQSIRVDFLEDARPGDYVMVHAGFAIQKMTEAEALENLKLLEDIRHAL
ncbi:MAG TPA: HypC/HybG/HupF family hydrogenase formation chaperone [Candidatus Onthocola gallistercoris]|uniref:HypC/HybG/HupF family hydrogenase formation chaperone n=1 Tax=Candidatus Onthocola gallistercoris TaxID=2840876 RepID=A0A9D1KVB7_9FIRM|nr:HypC/HybG/HupF family hydrogenase formation chaperone [Candidatus Onthocola gallistercoris]